MKRSPESSLFRVRLVPAAFITMYADIVMRVGREDFEHALVAA